MGGLCGKKYPVAGRFFDVHKHVLLIGVLTQLKQKLPKLHFIDAHAGAGIYEFPKTDGAEGVHVNIDALLNANRNELTDQYIEIVRSCNNSLPLSNYPGSPVIAQKLLGPLDSISLIELNLDDCSKLSGLFETSSQISVEHGSAFDRVLKRLPEGKEGGAVLIDPDYIIAEDLTDTANLVIQCRNKWNAAVIMVSLPASDRYIISLLKDSGVKNMYLSDFEFVDESRSDQQVLLNKSRILLINPQFEIIETLESALSQLAASLPGSVKAKSNIKAI